MKIMSLTIGLVFLAIGLWGCTDKNYSKGKPEDRDLEGTWALGGKSREDAEKAYRLNIAEKDGVIKINGNGRFETTRVPTSQPDFKPKLLSGSGEWKLSEYKTQSGYSIWRLNLIFEQAGSTARSTVSYDIGHEANRAYLNQPIDDPDGPVMRFDRVQ